MKVLLVNNYYYNRGGDCTYMFSLKELLEKHGHKVVVFSMKHPRNFDCEYSNYFVSHIDYIDELGNNNISSGIKVLKRTLYSIESKKKIEKLIQYEKPDIAHVQNIHHHITPSILYSLKKNRIPIVWTLHDYTLICPNTSFLAHGKICEKCKICKYYWPLFVRCKKDSIGASAMAALETVIHRLMRINDLVDVFIAPSRFLKAKFIEYGFDDNKLVHINHFIDYPVVQEKIQSDDYYLFVGRITEEKGVKTLIDAAIEADSSHLKIAGGGPLLHTMKKYAKEKDKNKIVEFLDHKSRNELLDYYKKCKFVVIPSEWYENAGLIIFESYACGKPVIGAGIGGIPEFVKDTERGLVFKAGDKDDLVATIKYMLNNPDLVAEMGENAKKYLVEMHRGEAHYREIIKIYDRLLLKTH